MQVFEYKFVNPSVKCNRLLYNAKKKNRKNSLILDLLFYLQNVKHWKRVLLIQLNGTRVLFTRSAMCIMTSVPHLCLSKKLLITKEKFLSPEEITANKVVQFFK